jgi:hypothetical protein
MNAPPAKRNCQQPRGRQQTRKPRLLPTSAWTKRLGLPAADDEAAQKSIEVSKRSYRYRLTFIEMHRWQLNFLSGTAWFMTAACENKSGPGSRSKKQSRRPICLLSAVILMQDEAFRQGFCGSYLLQTIRASKLKLKLRKAGKVPEVFSTHVP